MTTDALPLIADDARLLVLLTQRPVGYATVVEAAGLEPTDALVSKVERTWLHARHSQGILDVRRALVTHAYALAQSGQRGALDDACADLLWAHVRDLPRAEFDGGSRDEITAHFAHLRRLVEEAPELEAHPDAASSLSSAALSASDASIRSGVMRLLHGFNRRARGVLDEDTQMSYLVLARRGAEEDVALEDRVLLLHFAGPEHWETIVELITEEGVTLDVAASWFDKLYTHQPFEQAWSLIERVLLEAPWMLQRIVLSHLGPTHEAAIPGLSNMVMTFAGDPIVSQDIARALRRTEHIGSEPALVELAGHPADAVGDIAIQALGDLGTRAAIRPLAEVSERHPTRRASAQAAIASILGRYPVRADAGSLTLADHDDVAGALTLAGAGEGDLALYDDARRALSTPEHGGSALAPRHEPLPMPGLFNLPRTPREVPLLVSVKPWTQAGASGMMPALYAFLGLCLFGVAYPGLPTDMKLAGGLTYAVLMPIFFLAESRRARALGQMLRRGTPTYAQLIDKDVLEVHDQDGTYRTFHYTFVHVDADGVQRVEEKTFHEDMPQLEDDALEPALYHGDELVLIDRLPGITVREDGTFAPRDPLRSVVMLAAFVVCMVLPPIAFVLTFVAGLLL